MRFAGCLLKWVGYIIVTELVERTLYRAGCGR